jgi:hypothetical protein
VRVGTASPRRSFQRPFSSLQRKPADPFGITGRPVDSSRITVFHSGFSSESPRSEAVRNRSGVYPSPRSRSVTRSGRSVNRRA